MFSFHFLYGTCRPQVVFLSLNWISVVNSSCPVTWLGKHVTHTYCIGTYVMVFKWVWSVLFCQLKWWIMNTVCGCLNCMLCVWITLQVQIVKKASGPKSRWLRIKEITIGTGRIVCLECQTYPHAAQDQLTCIYVGEWDGVRIQVNTCWKESKSIHCMIYDYPRPLWFEYSSKSLEILRSCFVYAPLWRARRIAFI